MAREHLSLREILVFYYRYRTRLQRAFLVPFILIFCLSFVPTPRYEASSVLIVRLGSEYIYQPEVTSNRNGPESAIPFDRDQIFKSEVAILNSDDLHQQVLNDISVDKLYPELLKPSLLSQVWQQGAGFLQSMGLGEALSDEDQQKHLTALALHKFDKRLHIELEKSSAVITVSFQHANANLAKQVLDSLLQHYMEKRKQLYLEPREQLAEAQVNVASEKAHEAEKALEDFKRKHKIYSLTDQRASLLQARAEIDRKRASVTSAALDEKMGFFNIQLDQLDKFERDYNRLEHEKQIAEEEYANASHKHSEAQALEDLQRERVGSVRVIQPPTTPAEPKRWQFVIILLGGFIGLLSALAMAAFTEYTASGFLTPEGLERRLDIPVLGVVPRRD